MTGAQALIYARSRHGSSDFDRAARQQRVILSAPPPDGLRDDPAPALDELEDSLKSAVKTDIPPAKLPQLLELASRIDIANVRSFVFSPPLYADGSLAGLGERHRPNVGRIRAAVANAFNFDPSQEARARGGRRGGRPGLGRQRDRPARPARRTWPTTSTTAGSPPPPRTSARRARYPPTRSSASTTGPRSRLPKTIALLDRGLRRGGDPVTDPAVKVDVIVTIGTRTPKLQAPVTP